LFTGLVEATGKVLRPGEELEVAHSLQGDIHRGESISVDGACLTVTGADADRLSFYASPETLSRTVAGHYGRGRRVNLERPLKASGRLHGHFVTGHVDRIERVVFMRRSSRGSRARITLSADRSLVVAKGSVALDGISLTVAACGTGWFEVELIPETMDRTTAGEWRSGTRINLELDLLGKYVAARMGGGEGLRDKLDY
jgi:riboflavin synthase